MQSLSVCESEQSYTVTIHIIWSGNITNGEVMRSSPLGRMMYFLANELHGDHICRKALDPEDSVVGHAQLNSSELAIARVS